jgi:hypothetical protein
MPSVYACPFGTDKPGEMFLEYNLKSYSASTKIFDPTRNIAQNTCGVAISMNSAICPPAKAPEIVGKSL